MIRLTHLSGSLQGTASSSPKAVVRIGRGPDCDVRFDAHRDSRVSAHHAEIRFEDGRYVLCDVGSSNGTFVNGKMVKRQQLRSGDRLTFGAQGGPEARFDIDESWNGRGAAVGNAGLAAFQQASMPQRAAQRAPP